MTYSINNKNIAPGMTQSQSQSMGINYNQVPSASDVNQAASSNPLWRVLGSPRDVFITGAVTVPTWFGMSWLLHRFQEACKDTPGKPGMLQRMANWGDKVATSNGFAKRFFEGLEKYFGRTHKFFSEKIIGKSRILRSIFRVPTEPTNGLVTNLAYGAGGDIASGVASQVLNPYVSREYNPKAAESAFVNGKHLEKIQKMGFSSVEEFEDVMANAHKPENVRRIAQACERLGSDSFVIRRAYKIPFTNKYLTDFLPHSVAKFLARRFSFSSLANQLNAFENPKAATALGRMLPKATIRIIQSLTFGLGGVGKVGLLIQAIMLAAAVNKTFKAEKGDKTKTFMENIFSLVGWYLTIPLAIGIISHATGLKHIGMTAKDANSKELLEKYHKAWKDFNKKAEEGGFATKEEYKAAKKAVTSMLQTKWYYKPLKWLGDIFAVGRESLLPYVPKGASWFGKNIRKIIFFSKKGLGFPVRALPYFILLAPFFDKISVKSSHLIFGRPKKSILDEDKEDEKTEKSASEEMNQQVQGANMVNVAQQQAVQQAQQQAIQQAQQPQQQVQQTQPIQSNIQTQSPTTVVPPAATVGQPVNPSPTQPAVHAQHPSSVAKTEPTNQGTRNVVSQEPVRRYIPSSAPAHIQPQQYQATPQSQSAMVKASAAERNANRFIGQKSE